QPAAPRTTKYGSAGGFSVQQDREAAQQRSASDLYQEDGPERQQRPTSTYWLPAPAIVVFAGDLLAITGSTGHSAVGVSAEFTRLITRSLIGEGMARRLRCGHMMVMMASPMMVPRMRGGRRRGRSRGEIGW